VRPSLRTLAKNAVLDRIPGLLRKGPPGSRRIALTFDDGPDEVLTPKYLDVLDDLGVPATFFLLGESAARHPHLIGEYLRRGHQLASHGYDHSRFTKLSRRALLEQCARTEQAIGGQISGRPWVRPPHGSLGPSSIAALLAAQYTVALWSVDSLDYTVRDVPTLAEHCSPDRVSGGDVLLFHEGQQWTLNALPRIVSALHGAGYEIVTMHDLFAS
jgi:peptidoglycan/xylan/chitin deacetylase (PgdA/CDA1 family)